MGDEQEQIEEIVVAALPDETPMQKCMNYGKMVWTTKKALVAGHALFFGVTTMTAVGVSNGMSAEELIERDKMVEQVITLEERVVDLQTIIVNLNTVHTVNLQEHAPVEHEHEEKVWAEVDHEHQFIEHEHDWEYTTIPHDHDMTHEHEKQVCPVVGESIVIGKEHNHKFDPLRGCRSFYE